MGFKDLESFNLALLAKQIWRQLLELDSLCARVLRARHYPDGKLINAKLKSGSSYNGKVSCRDWSVLNMDIFGDWGMVLRLIYGRTVGFH